MLEFLAIGPGAKQRWRRQIQTDTTIRLGREPTTGWAVPWDVRISREHADLVFLENSVQVRCLETARNPAVFAGERKRQFTLLPGGEFQIGHTTFRLEADEAADVAVVGERPGSMDQEVAEEELGELIERARAANANGEKEDRPEVIDNLKAVLSFLDHQDVPPGEDPVQDTDDAEPPPELQIASLMEQRPSELHNALELLRQERKRLAVLLTQSQREAKALRNEIEFQRRRSDENEAHLKKAKEELSERMTHELQRREDEQLSQIEKLDLENRQLRIELAESKQLLVNERSASAASNQTFAELKREQLDADMQLSELRAELAAARSKATAENERAANDLHTLRAKLSSLRLEMEEKENSLRDGEQKLRALTASDQQRAEEWDQSRQEASETISELRRRVKELETDLQHLQSRAEEADRRIDRQDAELAASQSELTASEDRVLQLEEQLAQGNAAAAAAKQTNIGHEETITRLEQEREKQKTSHQSDIAAREKQLTAAKKERDRIEGELEETQQQRRGDRDQADSQRLALEAEVAGLQAEYENYQLTVQASTAENDREAADAIQAAADERKRLVDDLAESGRQLTDSKDQLAQAHQAIDEADRELADVRKSRSETKKKDATKIKQLEKQIHAKEEAITEGRALAARDSEEKQVLAEKCDRLIQQLEDKKTQLAELQTQRDETDAERDATAELLQSRTEQLSDDLEKARADAAADIDRLTRQLEDAQRLLDDRAEQLAEFERNAAAELNRMTQQLSESQRAADDAANRLAEFELSAAAEQESLVAQLELTQRRQEADLAEFDRLKKQLDSDRATVEERLDETQSKLAALSQQFQEQVDKNDQLTQVIARLNVEQRAEQEAAAELRSEIDTLQEERRQFVGSIAATEQRATEAEAAWTSRLADAERETADARRELTEKAAGLDEWKQQADRWQGKSEEQQAELKQAAERLAEQLAQIEGSEADKAALLERIQQADQREQSLAADVERLAEELAAEHESLSAAEVESIDNSQAAKDAQASAAQLQRDLEDAQAELDRHLSELAALRNDRDELKQLQEVHLVAQNEREKLSRQLQLAEEERDLGRREVAELQEQIDNLKSQQDEKDSQLAARIEEHEQSREAAETRLKQKELLVTSLQATSAAWQERSQREQETRRAIEQDLEQASSDLRKNWEESEEGREDFQALLAHREIELQQLRRELDRLERSEDEDADIDQRLRHVRQVALNRKKVAEWYREQLEIARTRLQREAAERRKAQARLRRFEEQTSETLSEDDTSEDGN